MSEILPGKLFLGPIECAMNADWLRTRGVRTVITVMKEHEDLVDLFDAVRAATRAAEVARHEVVPVDDWNKDGDRLAAALPACGRLIADTIDDGADGGTNNGGAVLVHCMMGVSRSATVVLAYLVAQRRMPLDEALRQVLKQRSWIFPNDAFTRELLALERRELGFSRHFPSDPPSAGLAAFRRFSYQIANAAEDDTERTFVV